MRRLFFPLVALAALAACAPKPAEPPAAERPVVLNEVRALNADAMVINGQHVRLSNAATPERIPAAKCWAEAIAGREARRKVTDMATAARDIQIVPTGGKDEYGRTYARVLFDGLDVGDYLIDDGLAVPPAAQRFDWCGPMSTETARTPNVNVLADLGR